jgi:hypothetical protein
MRAVWVGGIVAACSSSPTVIVPGTTAFSIALDDTSVYWISYDGLYSASKDGNDVTPTHLAAFGGGASLVSGVAVDSNAVYWAESGTCEANAADGAIMSVPLGGGTPTTLASQQACPAGLSIDTNAVYWATSAAILSTPKMGGAVTTIATGAMNPLSLTVDAANVYWTDFMGTVQFADKATGAITTLSDNLGFPRGIAVDSSFAYYAGYNGPDGIVAKSPLAGGAPTTLATDYNDPSWVAADSVHVYWTDTYKVFRTTLDGATTDTLDDQDYGVSAIAIDDDYVYWADDPSTNAVPVGLKRLAK